jgi:hypothetical protein
LDYIGDLLFEEAMLKGEKKEESDEETKENEFVNNAVSIMPNGSAVWLSYNVSMLIRSPCRITGSQSSRIRKKVRLSKKFRIWLTSASSAELPLAL